MDNDNNDIKTVNYEASMKELEGIVARMENEELNIDSLTSELKKAKLLIKQCRDVLFSTDEEIKAILEADED